jgi:hypothetical protein
MQHRDTDWRQELRAPFPWFGGKTLASPLIWRAFGNVPNYVEAFAGSLGCLLGRPHAAKVETVNDLDGYIANAWRAIKLAPDAVAEWCEWPVNEADLHARHRWLVGQAPLLERLIEDPDWFDPKIAGWWIWGICAWIGNGWCHSDERLHRSLPKVGTPGHGIHAPSRKKPLTHRNKGVHRDGSPPDIFERLSDRLRNVRVCCGDWTRVVGRSTLGIDTAHGMTPCGVLLDPPYTHELRDRRLYREDDAHVSALVREWAIANGDNPQLRIALCGFEGEHVMPPSWTAVAWASTSSAKSRAQERIWFSPHCLAAVPQQEFAL